MHRTEVLDGIARMRGSRCCVDAGQAQFAPNGMHVMLMGLKKPLVEGQKFELDLLFEVAGPRKVQVVVREVLDRQRLTACAGPALVNCVRDLARPALLLELCRS